MRQVAISIDFARSRALIDLGTAAARCLTRARTAPLSVALAVFAFLFADVGALAPAAQAQNFACDTTGGTWTAAADWSSCNGTYPNNGQPAATDTYDATVSSGTSTLGSAVTIDNVVTDSTATWTTAAPGSTITLNNALTNNGSFQVDAGGPGNAGGAGGTTVQIGGTLTNSGTVQIGNSNNLPQATMVTAAGLANTGGIVIDAPFGSGPTLVSLDVGSAAPSTWTGIAELQGNALLQFTGTSQISTIGSGSTIALNGPQAYLAAAGINNTSNSALSGLTSNLGMLILDDGASVTTSGGLSNSNILFVNGGTLDVGGTLTNNNLAEIGSAGSFQTSTVTATAMANTGTVDLLGNGAAGPAILTVAGGLTNAGSFIVDPTAGVQGGAMLTVGGTLANTGTVQIGNAGLTAPTTVTLGGLTNPTGASFALEGSASHAADLVFSGGGSGFTSNGGNFELTYASPLTLSAALTNSGTFGVHQNTTLGVDGGFGNSGTLEVDNGFSEAPVTGEGGSSLTITGTLANTGTVQVGNPNLSAPTTVTLGGLTNPTGASFALEGSASHAADLVFSGGGSGFTSNGGNFELTYASPLTLSAALTNSGTFGVHQNTTLGVDGGFGNSGTLEVDNGFSEAPVTGEGGSSLTITGTLANTGTVQVGNPNLSAPTTVTLGGLTNPTGASFALEGSASHAADLVFSGGGSGFTSNGGNFELTYASPLTLSAALTNSGTFGVHQNTTLGVDGGFGNSGTLEVDNGFSEAPVTGEGGSSLTITGTLANTGTVQVGNPNLSAPTTVTLGGLTNPTGASFALEGSASHAADLVFSGGGSGFTSNGGNFELTYASPLTLSAALTNSGTFGVHQNTTLGVDGGFGNSGTLEVDNGFSEAPVTGEGGSSLTITGTLANTGTVQVGNPNLSAPTTVTLGGLTNPTGASFALEGSASHAADLVFSGGGSGFTSNGGNFELTYASPLTLSAALTNSGTFGVHQNTTLGVDGGFGNSGTLEVDNGFSEAPVTGEGGSSLTITGTLANTGTVQVGNPNLSAPTTVTLGGLTNPTGASFALEGSASHAADLVFSGGGSGFTSNGGNFELTYASPLTLSAALTNSGTFGVHQNTTLGVDGGFGNSGTLEVDNGFSEAPVTGEGGSSLTITGTLANTGTVQVGNPNLSAPTTVTLGGLTNPTGASFALEGSASHAADLVFSGGGSGFTSNGGNFELTYASPLTLSAALTNSGTFGVHQNTTLGVDGGFGNSGTLEVDNGFSEAPVTGEGGSSLTITGTLANTGTVQVGNPNLSAPTTVTAAALTNSGTIGLLGNTGNPANQSSLTVNGAASNAGTVNIPTATSVTVTGAGNAYTQTAGFTNLSGGTLTAPSVNINGGTLQGMGTITGALSISGTGGIQAVDLANNSLPAVLTVNGTYAQSGGAFDALLHGTGTQIDEVQVGSGDSVNLTGGNLQVSGVTFALGQMFNDIVTFQPGDLSGTFATINGGGNGLFTSIGGGLFLEALYNDAAGNISLEVTNTPPSTTIIWNDATGNWTTDTTKWTPTGPPQSFNDVIIGSTTNGNVTLNNSTTINSLTINPSNALTNTSGTTLTVTTTVGNSGSLTLGGNLTATGAVTNNAGATLTMQGGTLSAASFTNAGTTGGFGTINPAIANTGLVQANGGTLTAQDGIQGTGNVTVDSGAALTIGANSTAGTLTQNGTLNLGANNVTVSSDYVPQNFSTTNSGNAFNKLAGVTGTGQILAAGPTPANMEVITGPDVTNGNTTTPTLGLGILHVGDSTAYQIANEGTTANPSLRGAIQTDVNGGNITGNVLTGTGVTADNFGPIAPGTSTTNYTVTAANPGLLSGQGVHFANNFGNVPEQTMSITGQVNNYAALAFEQTGGQGTLSGGGTSYDLDFGNVLQGSTAPEAMLAILNDNPLAEQAFTDLLSTSPTGLTPPFSLTGCSVSDLPGGDSQSCDVFLDTGSLGSISDLLTFDVESSNASGYDQIIGDVTLNLEGDIVSSTPAVPEPSSIALLVSGLGVLFFVVRRERQGR